MIEMVIPSSVDPTVAPPGHHVCLLLTQYTPYHLSNGVTWDEGTKEQYAKQVRANHENHKLICHIILKHGYYSPQSRQIKSLHMPNTAEQNEVKYSFPY